jgi:cell wall-associated NlpC family hydrolase
MQKNIPLLPFWLSLVLIAIAIALPTSSVQAASKKHAPKVAVHSSKLSKHASNKSNKFSKKSKKHASCNRVLGKQQALSLINNNGQLCRLAGFNSAEEIPTKATNIGSTAEISIQNKFANYADNAEENLPDEGEDLAELEREDNVTVDIEAFKSLWLAYIDDGGTDSKEEMLACGINKKKIMAAIMDWVGTNYHFGGSSRSGIDCSSFTRTIFATAGDFMLPRTAAEQIETGTKIRSREKMQFGDIVFFHTRRQVYVSHVGIYLGDNLFAHASSRYGVTVSSLESEYYSKRLIGVKRLQRNDVVRYALGNQGYVSGTE